MASPSAASRWSASCWHGNGRARRCGTVRRTSGPGSIASARDPAEPVTSRRERHMTVLILLGALLAAGTDSLKSPVKNVVLVHGAWADGSSWAKVIPFLEAAGPDAVGRGKPPTSRQEP